MQYISVSSIYQAPPTAELEPLSEGSLAQTDEVSVGLVVYIIIILRIHQVII